MKPLTPQAGTRSRAKRAARPIARIEALEGRRLLSAGDPDSIVLVPVLNGSTLNHDVIITGTTQSDEISAVVDPANAKDIEFLIITPGVTTVGLTVPQSQTQTVIVYTDPAGSSSGDVADDADVVNFGGVTFAGVTQITTGPGNDTVIGANSGNSITGGNGRDVLYGGAANDTIHGGTSPTIIHGGAGDDLLIANGAGSVLQGGLGNDSVIGVGGNDTLRGGAGDDFIGVDKGNNNLLIANAGNDSLEAGDGATFALTGDHQLIATTANDTLLAGSGNDTVNAGTAAVSDFIGGNNSGFLTLEGTTPPANTGNDSILGNNGNDTLAAIGGADTLVAGTGLNNYFAVNDKSAIIEHYSRGGIAENDILTSKSTETIQINLTINVVIGGVTTPVSIPITAGASPLGTSAVEAINSTGTIQFRWNAPRTFTLADFFNHWGVPFSATGVGQFQALGFGHTFTMTVNGVVNNQFGAYQVQNGDNVALTWTE
jgi:Ca2+-binding RTX toxin-like protein